MNQRHDALLAAARYIDAVNRIVTSIPGRQVGTVGKIQAFPGAYNVVPGKVATSLGLRDLDASTVQTMFDRIQAEVRRIEDATGTIFQFTPVTASTPAPTDSRIRATIDASAKQLGLTRKLMPSGAGHDAQEMADLGPMGMIFIPSRDGISHSPREFSTPEDITNGTNVLLQSVLRLDAVDTSASDRRRAPVGVSAHRPAAVGCQQHGEFPDCHQVRASVVAGERAAQVPGLPEMEGQMGGEVHQDDPGWQPHATERFGILPVPVRGRELLRHGLHHRTGALQFSTRASCEPDRRLNSSSRSRT